MARVKLSPIIASINGKIGNAVFQGGKSGIILREKVQPRNRNTTKQVQARNRLSTIKRAWQSLNTTQRDSWISFASFYQKKTKHNSTKILTGYEVFMQHNSVRYQGNYDILETTTFEVYSIDLVDAYLSLPIPSQLNFEVAIVPEDDVNNVAVYISKPFRQSSSIAKSEVRFILSQANPIELTNITSLYLDLFQRLPQSGEKVLLKIVGFSNTSGWTSKQNYQEITLV